MNAALLRSEKLKWYRRNTITNSYGEYKENLDYLGTIRAGILNQTESKSFMNDELQFIQTRRFIIRHYVQIKENDVIEWNGRKWNVNEIIPNRYYRDQEINVSSINE